MCEGSGALLFLLSETPGHDKRGPGNETSSPGLPEATETKEGRVHTDMQELRQTLRERSRAEPSLLCMHAPLVLAEQPQAKDPAGRRRAEKEATRIV